MIATASSRVIFRIDLNRLSSIVAAVRSIAIRDGFSDCRIDRAFRFAAVANSGTKDENGNVDSLALDLDSFRRNLNEDCFDAAFQAAVNTDSE